MIKAIIFDCWNTVFHTDIKPHPFATFAKLLGEDFDDYKYIKKFENHLMLEKHKNIRKPILSLLEELKIKPSEDLIKKLEELFEIAQLEVRPYSDTFEVLDKLKGKYKLGLITNTDYLGYKTLQEKFKVDELFNLSLKSYELKMSKPNPKVYEKMLKGLGVKPEEALMVGDSYEDDFKASMAQGMNALLIDRRERYQDVSKRITSLSELLDNI